MFLLKRKDIQLISSSTSNQKIKKGEERKEDDFNVSGHFVVLIYFL